MSYTDWRPAQGTSDEVRELNTRDYRFVAFPVATALCGAQTALAIDRITKETGEHEFTIISLEDTSNENNGCACPDCAPHEQEGVMPTRYWHRAWGEPTPCQAITRKGRQCFRNAADDDPDDLCPTHRAVKRRQEQRREATA